MQVKNPRHVSVYFLQLFEVNFTRQIHGYELFDTYS